MNDQDYDEDRNNIVPCPICLNVYCPSKEDGKCPDESAFINPLTSNDPKAIDLVEAMKQQILTNQ